MKRYTYNLIRYVHDPVAEEFVNVGVVMSVPETGELHAHVDVNYGRLSQFFNNFAAKTYSATIRAVETRLDALSADPQAPLTFTANGDDLLLQAIRPDGGAGISLSAARTGRHPDPAKRFQEICAQILHESTPSIRPKNARGDMQKQFVDALRRADAERFVSYDFSLQVSEFRRHAFTAGWQNGVTHVTDVISLDLKKPQHIIDRAYQFGGLLADLARENEFLAHPLLVPPRREDCLATYYAAREVLAEHPTVGHVYDPQRLNELVDQVLEHAVH